MKDRREGLSQTDIEVFKVRRTDSNLCSIPGGGEHRNGRWSFVGCVDEEMPGKWRCHFEHPEFASFHHIWRKTARKGAGFILCLANLAVQLKNNQTQATLITMLEKLVLK